MPKPITQTLALLQGGTFLDQMTDAFAALVVGVDETGKAGKLTVTLDLKKKSGRIEIDSKVTTKVPEPKADADLLWPTTEGNLVLENPAQRKLGLEDVTQTKELRTG